MLYVNYISVKLEEKKAKTVHHMWLAASLFTWWQHSYEGRWVKALDERSKHWLRPTWRSYMPCKGVCTLLWIHEDYFCISYSLVRKAELLWLIRYKRFFSLDLFLAALGLRCCARAFSSCGKGGYFSLKCAGLSLQWPLSLQSMGSRCADFSSRGTWAQ